MIHRFLSKFFIKKGGKVEDFRNKKKEIYCEQVRAGKRTYFFDIKATRSNDYYITITESKRKVKDEGEGFFYEKHKIFLYKEDFDRFIRALTNSVKYAKEELLTDDTHSSYSKAEKALASTPSEEL